MLLFCHHSDVLWILSFHLFIIKSDLCGGRTILASRNSFNCAPCNADRTRAMQTEKLALVSFSEISYSRATTAAAVMAELDASVAMSML
jgi:hypothetical protein